MKPLFTLFCGLVLLTDLSFGQCSFLPNALVGPTLQCVGGTTFRSGVAYNPNFDLLYSVNSGSSSYNIETFDPQGNPLNSTAQGFDFRGLWWNPTLNSLEGNGYNTNGIFVEDLGGATGYPLGTGTVVFPGMNQPFAHSCGQFDPVNNQILYYYNGAIHRYSRSTGGLLGTTPISGLPVATSNLNTTSIAYTGCPGQEVGVYDYVNRRVYLISLATGAYVATSQLPADAPTPTNQRMSYANDLFWIFNESTLVWHSYEIIDECPATINTISVNACETYTSPSGDFTWNTSGVYTDTLPNAAGCDSLLTINLTINQNKTNTINVNACDSYTVPSGSNTYTASGSYADIIPTAAGCDSLLVINLTINTVQALVAQTTDTLYASPVGGSYQWLDCDAGYSPIAGANNATYTLTASGNYAVEVMQNGCVDTSSCYNAIASGIFDNSFGPQLRLFPNPTVGQFSLDLGSWYENVRLTISNLHGQTVVRQQYPFLERTTLDLPGATGVYMVHILTASGKQATIKLLKE